jgi:hypothetical protein
LFTGFCPAPSETDRYNLGQGETAMPRRSIRAVQAVVVVPVAIAGSAAPNFVGLAHAQGRPANQPEHCVVHLPDVPTQVNASESEHCFATYAEAMRFVGYTNVPDNASPVTWKSKQPLPPRVGADGSPVTDAIIAKFIDADSVDPNDISFSVTGSNCNGGSITFSSHWDNRFDSVEHTGCTIIKHHFGVCDSSPDFVTQESLGALAVYSSSQRNREDCASFHHS